MSKIEVRPLPHKTWHGKTGKESFKQAIVIEALYDNQTGGYATGLTDKEAQEYGKKIGVSLSSVFNLDEPHPFYGTKKGQVKLLNQTMFFYTDKPLDFVRVALMKASKFVANSMKEYEEGLFPDATHVIFSEEEEVALKAKKIQLRDKCGEIKIKMTPDEKVNVIQILSETGKSVRGMSPNFIDVELDAIIENKPSEFIRYAQMNKEEVYTRATILEAIQRNVLNKESGALYYMGDIIAPSYEDAVTWFLDPQNQKMKVAILEKLNG